MLRLPIIVLALALAGCLVAEDRAPLAPIPDEGIFVAMAWACGMQPHPMGDLIAVFANGTFYHLALEKAEQPIRTPDLDVGEAEATRVVEAVSATGIAAGSYNRLWLTENATLVHAERLAPGTGTFDRLRRDVAAANFSELRPEYDGDTQIDDGCNFSYAAFSQEGGFDLVSAIDDGGPDGLDRLRVNLLSRHPGS